MSWRKKNKRKERVKISNNGENNTETEKQIKIKTRKQIEKYRYRKRERKTDFICGKTETKHTRGSRQANTCCCLLCEFLEKNPKKNYYEFSFFLLFFNKNDELFNSFSSVRNNFSMLNYHKKVEVGNT